MWNRRELQLKTLFLTLSAATLASNFAHAAIPNRYQVVELPTLCDTATPTLCGAESFAYDLNNSGVVVGYSRGPLLPDTADADGDGNTTENVLSFSAHGFSWQAGVMTDLGHLGKNESIAVAINDNGDVVGRSKKVTAVSGTTETVQTRAFVVRFGETIADVGVPTQTTNEIAATDISNGGYIVGYARAQVISGDTTFYPRGFIWSPVSQSVVLIPSLQEKTESVLRAVNDTANRAVGYAYKDGIRRAIAVALDTPATLIELGDLGGSSSEANDIDDSGRIVGRSLVTGNGRSEAFLYDPSQTPNMRSLGQLGNGFTFSQANAISNEGLVVGTAQASSYPARYHATVVDVTDPAAQLVDLNSRIECADNSAERWRLTEAIAVNDAGQIIGYGSKGNSTRAFLLNPINDASLPSACPEEPEFENKSGGGAGAMSLLLPLFLVLRRCRRSSCK